MEGEGEKWGRVHKKGKREKGKQRVKVGNESGGRK